MDRGWEELPEGESTVGLEPELDEPRGTSFSLTEGTTCVIGGGDGVNGVITGNGGDGGRG